MRALLAAFALLLAGCGSDPEPRPAPSPEPTPAAAGDGRYFGFNDSSPLRGQMTPRQNAELAVRAGANSVRLTIEWQHTEGAPGKVDLRPVTAVYRAHIARGSRPLLVVTGAPRWAWPPGRGCPRGGLCGQPVGPAHDADFARFAALVAQRFPQAAGIEIWNEPNLRSQWLPRPDPARYAQLLAAARAAIKAVSPDMPVLGGSVAAILRDDVPQVGMSITSFLEGMGPDAPMDGLSVHAYPSPADRERGDKAIQAALAIRDDVPLWITEVGLSSGEPGADEQLQAEILREVVPPLRERADVRGVYVHTLVEPTVHPEGSAERGYGLLRPDLSPKPGYCVFARC